MKDLGIPCKPIIKFKAPNAKRNLSPLHFLSKNSQIPTQRGQTPKTKTHPLLQSQMFNQQIQM